MAFVILMGCQFPSVIHAFHYHTYLYRPSYHCLFFFYHHPYIVTLLIFGKFTCRILQLQLCVLGDQVHQLPSHWRMMLLYKNQSEGLYTDKSSIERICMMGKWHPLWKQSWKCVALPAFRRVTEILCIKRMKLFCTEVWMTTCGSFEKNPSEMYLYTCFTTSMVTYDMS